jgi:alkylation response protein AidB-like acyl-CoA dehydrogenase
MVEFAERDVHTSIRLAVKEIAADFGHEYFLRCAREHRFVDELWEVLFASGFGGVNLPEEWGGGGGGVQEIAIVIEELAASGCPVVFLVVSAMCGPLIAEYGTDEQRGRWLPGLASGSHRMSFATTEADAGSNIYNTATKARWTDGRWVLSGTKLYITGVDSADTVMVVARTGSESDGRATLSLFVVDVTSPGVVGQPMSLEITAPEQQCVLSFANVEVENDRLIGEVPDLGFRQIFAALNPERVTTAAQGIGLGRYFLTKAASYARLREVWGVPIGAHQGVAHHLAEAKIHLDLAQLMTSKAAWLCDSRGDGVGEASAVAKLASADAALECFERAMQVHGGSGFATETGIAALWGLTRLMTIGPVSREMVLNYVAQHSLHLPRSY